MPSGKTCTISSGVKIARGITVNSDATLTVNAATIVQSVSVGTGATLIDKGASIGGSLSASVPEAIGINGSTTAAAIMGSISITGITGTGPGTNGDNYVCDTNIGGSVSISAGASTAGAFIFGDTFKHCTLGPDQLGGSVSVSGNRSGVDISFNKKGVAPYMVGILGSLSVSGQDRDLDLADRREQLHRWQRVLPGGHEEGQPRDAEHRWWHQQRLPVGQRTPSPRDARHHHRGSRAVCGIFYLTPPAVLEKHPLMTRRGRTGHRVPTRAPCGA